MEEKTFKITLADGTELEGLTLNGNNYISSKRVTEEDLNADNLASITIEDSDGNVQELTDMALVQIEKRGTSYWFVLRQLSEQEIRDFKLQANIEYIVMMADIDLEEV